MDRAAPVALQLYVIFGICYFLPAAVPSGMLRNIAS